ncbi:MAG: hypothetical protein Q4D13_07880 [Erysipelotrichaceae bacterium]|nr:hypothetical protein [Erysipelotrichaceae bacterium]
MKDYTLPPINDIQLKEINELKSLSDDEINLTDIPELNDIQLNNGHPAYQKDKQ